MLEHEHLAVLKQKASGLSGVRREVFGFEGDVFNAASFKAVVFGRG